MKASEKLDKLLEYSARHDERLKGVESELGEVKTQVKKTNGRVTCLEAWKSKISGQVALGVAILSFSVNIAWQYIKDIFKG